MSKLLHFLLRFLVLPVGEADPPPPDTDPAPAGEDTLDDLIDASADLPEPDPGSPDTPDAVATAPRRATPDYERELLVERTRRETLEQMQRPTPISRGDPEFEAEEQRLADARKTMDANSYGWLKWQTDQTRANRATQREAQNALREARDVSDRAAFDRVQTTNPGLYKLYADKVESEVVRLRNAGVQVPGRRDILKYLAGNDLLDGKLKKTTAAPRPSTPAAPTQTVDRGRMPVTRSDVRGRANAASDAEKRAERLRNVNI